MTRTDALTVNLVRQLALEPAPRGIRGGAVALSHTGF